MSIALKATPDQSQKEHLESEVTALLKLVLEQLPAACEPISGLWYGSFARGESGVYPYRGRWLPFGDYDFEIICRRPPRDEEVRRIERAVLERFGYRPVTSPVEETLTENATTFNVLDLKFSTPGQFVERSPDLSTYDLLHASRVMFGKDLRQHVRLDIDRVPLFSAYRMMFNRLFHALSLFKLDLWDPEHELTHQEKVAFSLAICRIWLEFSTALSLCLGVYAPDYETRLDNLAREGERIALWFRDWEGLLEGIRVAVEFKQTPRPDRLNTLAIRRGYFLALESWDRVMRVVQSQRLPYYFGRGNELEKVDYWNEAAEVCQKELPRQYYRDYLRVMLAGRGRKLSDRTINLLARLSNVYENYGFMGLPFLLKHPKRSLFSPEIIYFACVPLLAFSITPLGKVHYGMLNQVLNLVSPYRKSRITLTSKENWQEVKDLCVELFSAYRAKKPEIRRLPRWLTK